LHGDQIAETEDLGMPNDNRFSRIHLLLRAAGHDPAKAAEILRDARRKDAHARVWIKTIAASRRSVLPNIQ
jgi:hypothetical protein